MRRCRVRPQIARSEPGELGRRVDQRRVEPIAGLSRLLLVGHADLGRATGIER